MDLEAESKQGLETGLSNRVIRSGVGMLAFKAIQQVINLFRLIVIARILTPHHFGIVGVALLSIEILETFSQPGFEQALIQKKESIRSYLDAAWTILLLRGMVLFVAMFIIAPLLSYFFQLSEAQPMIQIIGLAFLFKGLTNIGVVYFQKELQFNKRIIYQGSGTVASFIVSLTAVFILRNVWALVLGYLAGHIVRCIVSYYLYPYKPHLDFDGTKMRELFSYGKWVLGSSILLFLINHGDDIFVGKFVGVAALGFYQMAFTFSNLPVTKVVHTISQVTFPAYAKLQDDIQTLKAAYFKVLRVTACISFPLAGLIFILALDFIQLFLGDKWLPMLPAVQVLCFFAVARAIGATQGALFYGTNNPRFLTITTFIKLICLGILIYPLTKKFGFTGAALATTIPVVISQGYCMVRARGILGARLKDMLVPIIVAFMGTFVMVLALGILKTVTSQTILSFIVHIIVGFLVYGIFVLGISKYVQQCNIVAEFSDIIKGIRKK